MKIFRKRLLIGSLALLLSASTVLATSADAAVSANTATAISVEASTLSEIASDGSLGAGADVSTGSSSAASESESSSSYVYSTSAETRAKARAYVISSRKQCARFLRKMMLARKTTAYMYWTGSLSSLMKNIGTTNRLLKMMYKDVRLLDSSKNLNDGDYLLSSVLYLSWQGAAYQGHYLIQWKFTYCESKPQTRRVNRVVDQTIQELGLHRSCSLRTRIRNLRAVHNYICRLVNYDTSASPSHSAYAGLVSSKHLTVCQGYTGIMYKFCQKLGIPVHIMNGWGYYKSSNTTHSWNIVRLGKKWYGIDATWDDTNRSNRYYTYTYFLKGTNVFNDEHILNTCYNGIYNLSKKRFNWKKYV